MHESKEESAVVPCIVSQYQASLEMLKEAIQACPEDFWHSIGYHNCYWHVAYHALFYTHLYLHASEADFKPWSKHKSDSQLLGPGPRGPEGLLVPYSKEEVMEFHELCCKEVAARVPAVSLDAGSGFHWLPFNRLELHFYNIRHIQHHTGQLADRLRNALNIATPWIRMG
jgi:hypothetical protein